MTLEPSRPGSGHPRRFIRTGRACPPGAHRPDGHLFRARNASWIVLRLICGALLAMALAACVGGGPTGSVAELSSAVAATSSAANTEKPTATPRPPWPLGRTQAEIASTIGRLGWTHWNPQNDGKPQYIIMAGFEPTALISIEGRPDHVTGIDAVFSNPDGGQHIGPFLALASPEIRAWVEGRARAYASTGDYTRDHTVIDGATLTWDVHSSSTGPEIEIAIRQ